jgi:hypothetical protein
MRFERYLEFSNVAVVRDSVPADSQLMGYECSYHELQYTLP